MATLRPSRASRRRQATVPAVALVIVALAMAACGGGSTSDPPSAVSVSGTSDGWVFHDGQTVTVSKGANHTFKPYSHVNIIQCADPDGTKANLPTKFIQCDENTIQSDTVVVEADGSFKEKAFTVFALPSRTLGESKDGIPICSQTHQCVLLVSEYQTDLSKPHVFSHAFTIQPASSSGGGS
jgi:hypothetical protein